MRFSSLTRTIRSVTIFLTVALVCLFFSEPEQASNISKISPTVVDIVQPGNEVQVEYPNPCADKQYHEKQLVVVWTAWENKSIRDQLRQGSALPNRCGLKIVFLRGVTTGTHADPTDITEARSYRDIAFIRNVNHTLLSTGRGTKFVQLSLEQQGCRRYHQVIYAVMDRKVNHLLSGTYFREMNYCLRWSDHKVGISIIGHIYLSRPAQHVARSGKENHNAATLPGEQPAEFRQLHLPRGQCMAPLGKGKLVVLIAVHTSPEHGRNREIIRWAMKKASGLNLLDMRTVFFMGVKGSVNVQTTVDEESAQHGDIYQENFADSYRNMTLKQISVLRYVSVRCKSTRFDYVLKMDDDVVLDVPLLVRNIVANFGAARHFPNAILCVHLNEFALVPRDPGKWYVSEEEFPDEIYPAYCSGAAYLIPKTLVLPLYGATSAIKIFWVDDTFVTGLVPREIGNVTLIQLPNQFLMHAKSLLQNAKVEGHWAVHVSQDVDVFKWYYTKLVRKFTT